MKANLLPRDFLIRYPSQTSCLDRAFACRDCEPAYVYSQVIKLSRTFCATFRAVFLRVLTCITKEMSQSPRSRKQPA